MNYQDQLKASNLSVTSVRLVLLECLDEAPHSDANQIFDLVKAQIKTTSIQAIYKNLNTLVEHNLIREIKPKGLSAIYETRVGDNHHHLVCRLCDKVCDTECLGSAPCVTSVNPQGFKIDEAEIIFWGVCPDCQANHNKGEK